MRKYRTAEIKHIIECLKEYRKEVQEYMKHTYCPFKEFTCESTCFIIWPKLKLFDHLCPCFIRKTYPMWRLKADADYIIEKEGLPDGIEQTPEDIKIIDGNANLLLIAPHGVGTKPKDDINTDKLTYRIAERLKCSAIVNDVFKRTDLDFNNIIDASFHKTYIPTIRNVVDAPDRTLVIWVHGIDDSNLKTEIAEMGVKDDVQALIGYGQPDRSTAEKTTVDDLIRSFTANSIIAHVARVGSNYGGNSTRYMNQYFSLNRYKLTDVQSVQLEFRYKGVRRAEDLDQASQNISNALFSLWEGQ